MNYYANTKNLVADLIQRMCDDFHLHRTSQKTYEKTLSEEVRVEDISIQAFPETTFSAGILSTCENKYMVKIHGQYFQTHTKEAGEDCQHHFQELLRQLVQIWNLQVYLV